MSEITRKGIADGLKPKVASAAAVELRQQFHAAAMQVLTTGAPGLSEATRNSIASAIALRCERVVQSQERAA